MRKIILNLAVTIDGFIEGPNGETDWCKMDDSSDMGEGSGFDKFLSGVDTIFYGRVSYDLWGQYQPGNDASAAEKKSAKTKNLKNRFTSPGVHLKLSHYFLSAEEKRKGG